MTYTAQRGEDQLLEKIFAVVGPTNKWCVEFGAADGQHRSNTWFFINEQDWSSVQIEAARTINLSLRTPWADSFEKLRQRYENNPRVICLNKQVGLEGEHRLDAILAATPLPRNFDLLSIDVDGLDYDIWQSLANYQPRVVIIEHNKTIPIEISFHSPQGSSLRALAELGRRKGYELAAANDLNGIFVERSLFSKLEIADNAPEKLWPTHHPYRMYATENNLGSLNFFGPPRVRWARGVDGTLPGQIKAGHYAWLPEGEETLPLPVISTPPRRYFSGWLRQWLT